MFQVKIFDTNVSTRNGISQKNGKPYSMREQAGFIVLPGKPVPVEIKLNLEDGQEPYPVGEHPLAPDSFYVAKYGKLEVRPRLTVLVAAARKAA